VLYGWLWLDFLRANQEIIAKEFKVLVNKESDNTLWHSYLNVLHFILYV